MKFYDTIIIGAGVAGLSACLYASRSGLKTAIIEYGMTGGQLHNTETIDNYLGFSGILAEDLAVEMEDSAMRFGAESIYGKVEKVKKEGNLFTLKMEDGDYMFSKTVIVATGTTYKKLGVKGEEKYPVSSCAICDGIFYKGKEVVVVGGGDSAFEEADYLTNYANKVTILFYKSEEELKAKPHLQKRIKNNEKINLRCNVDVQEIIGSEGNITGVNVLEEDGELAGYVDIPTDGVFVYIGNYPQSEMVKDVVSSGYINVDENMETRVSGIFAVGDIVNKKIRQVANAVGEGAIAGQSVYNYLKETREI